MDRQYTFLKVKTKIADMYILNPTEYSVCTRIPTVQGGPCGRGLDYVDI